MKNAIEGFNSVNITKIPHNTRKRVLENIKKERMMLKEKIIGPRVGSDLSTENTCSMIHRYIN